MTLVVIGFFFFPLVMAQEVVNNAYGGTVKFPYSSDIPKVTSPKGC